MRRRRVMIVLAVCVLVVIGVMVFWPGEREPEYNGKRLSEWVKTYPLHFDDDEKTNELIQREREAADHAIQQMGTNGLHWLVRWIAYEPPIWKSKIRKIMWKLPEIPFRRWYVNDVRLTWEARSAFESLGTNAAAAVPELSQVVETAPSLGAREQALWALSFVEADPLPRLLKAFEDRKLKRKAADYILRIFRTDDVDISRAIPEFLLIDRATKMQAKEYYKTHPYPMYFQPDYDYVLSELRFKNPPFFIPTLASCLRDPNNDVRAEAAKNLGYLGARARQAVPALRRALDERVIEIQEAAINALEQIAPEVLTNGVNKADQ